MKLHELRPGYSCHYSIPLLGEVTGTPFSLQSIGLRPAIIYRSARLLISNVSDTINLDKSTVAFYELPGERKCLTNLLGAELDSLQCSDLTFVGANTLLYVGLKTCSNNDIFRRVTQHYFPLARSPPSPRLEYSGFHACGPTCVADHYSKITSFLQSEVSRAMGIVWQPRKDELLSKVSRSKLMP